MTADGSAVMFEVPSPFLLGDTAGEPLSGVGLLVGNRLGGLYRIDEESLRVELVAGDLAGGTANASPEFFGVGDDLAYFLTRERKTEYGATAASNVYASDGTAAGTLLLATASLVGEPVVDALGQAFFLVEGDGGLEVWTTDGSHSGTYRVSEIHAASEESASVRQTLALDEGIALVTSSGTGVKELWTADSETGSLERLIASPDLVEELELVAATRSTIFFETRGGIGLTSLWAVDRSGGTSRALLGGLSERSFVLGDRLVQVRLAGGELPRAEVWSTDGTAAGTVRLGVGCTEGLCEHAVAWAPSVEGYVYFYSFVDLETGGDLWRTDGTLGGTELVARMPRADRDELRLPWVVELPDRLVFSAVDQAHGREPWSVKVGDPRSAAMIADLWVGAGRSGDITFTPIDDEETFFLTCELGSHEAKAWVTKGTPDSTRGITVPPVPDVLQSCGGETPPFALSVGGRLFVVLGARLWALDRQADRLEEIHELARPFQWYRQLFASRETLVFLELENDHSRLLVVDPGAGTARLVAELEGRARDLVAGNGEVYFVVEDLEGDGGLWRSDLTTEGTVLWRQLPSGVYYQGPMLLVEGDVFFWGSGSGPDEGLFRSSAGGAGAIELLHDMDDVFEVSVATSTESVLMLVSTYEFPRTGVDATWTLLRLHRGLVEELAQISGIQEASPPRLVATEEAFFFAARFDDRWELWRTDGSAAGTTIAVVTPLTQPWGDLTAFDGRLFFITRSQDHGWELWTSDGTPEGTRLLRDLWPGALSSRPRRYTATSHGLFLQAEDGLHGAEPWVVTPGATCKGSALALCLQQDRFRVAMSWRDHGGSLREGYARPLTGDTGAFWFFEEEILENVVKIVDGRPINGAFWLFAAGLTDLEYQMTVTDTELGLARRYYNPPSSLASYADTRSLAQEGIFAAGNIDVTTLVDSLGSAGSPVPSSRKAAVASEGGEDCLPSPERLCLLGGRFAVEVLRGGGSESAEGRAMELSDRSGAFWFFDADNLEIVVKLVDGRAVNGHHWVFFASLSDVEFTVEVTDSVDGSVRNYYNAPGNLASRADTSAF